MDQVKVLLVDHDGQFRRNLRRALTNPVYLVVEARTGEEALEEIRVGDDLGIVLLGDLIGTGMDALETCREIRRISPLPILMISALRKQERKIQAFDAGSDDYLVRPFGVGELLSRMHALRRRTSGLGATLLFESGGLTVDFERRRVTVEGRPVHLTAMEFEVLRYLVLKEGKPVSHQALLHSIWGLEHSREVQRLRVTINQLRRKIESDRSRIRYIHTEHQFGYRFQSMLQSRER